MKKLALTLFCLLGFASSWAQEKLEWDNTDSTITEEGQIVVTPGQEVWIQFKKNGNKLVDPEQVKAGTKGSYVLRLRAVLNFKDETTRPKGKDPLLDFMLKQFPDHTVLIVEKKFAEELVYDCLVKERGGKELVEKRNLPVVEQQPMFEQYPAKLSEIVLGEFQIKPKNKKGNK